MKKFIVHYGVFTILLIMAVGMVWIARNYSVRSKQAVTLFVDGGVCRAYVAGSVAVAPRGGDTIKVSQTQFGDFAFTVDSVRREPASMVLFLQPVDSSRFVVALNGNTYASGFVFNGSETIGRLLEKKLRVGG